ncbi:hypothetical protein D3C71_2112040 [compost metagenome]
MGWRELALHTATGQRPVSLMRSRKSSGEAVAILARALRAAWPSPSSGWAPTQRAPSTSASSSSGVNISGGRKKPGLSI